MVLNAAQVSTILCLAVTVAHSGNIRNEQCNPLKVKPFSKGKVKLRQEICSYKQARFLWIIFGISSEIHTLPETNIAHENPNVSF